ncbi:MAG: hypothetical protein EOS23_26510 [Mesorhizobium sp.]|nr:MAG: hypothetical protein EOS23_26510 [Mesorhizobium sp.]
MSAARQLLADAHARMTPAEIAAHALELATVLETNDEALVAVAETCRSLIAGYESAVTQFGNLQIGLRTIASLNASRRFKDARKLAGELAAVELVKMKMPPAPVHVPAEVAWPDIFRRKGAR